jgi:hypothetical protein
LPAQEEDKEITFSLSTLDCEGRGPKGVVIQVIGSGGRQNFYITSRWAPFLGSDVGVALTLVDRWKDPKVEQPKDPNNPDGETELVEKKRAFRVNPGMSFYYSFSELLTERFRPIVGVNLVNFDDSDDTFEIGLSTGLIWKLTAIGKAETTGFAMAAGVGYNLMEDDHDARWYTFVGFSINFQQK